MQPKNAKQKGRRLQQAVAEDLREAFPQLTAEDVRVGIISEAGVDIHLSLDAKCLIPLGIECKAKESLNIWAALQQAEANAKKEQQWPCVVFKRNRSETYAVLKWADLLRLLKNAQAK